MSCYDSVLINRLQTDHWWRSTSQWISQTSTNSEAHISAICQLADICEIYFMVPSISKSFQSVDKDTTIDFIKETHFYHKV